MNGSAWIAALLLAASQTGRAQAAAAVAAVSSSTTRVSVARPSQWAQPMARPGLTNFFRVSDQLFRGAQPTSAGLQELKKLGVKTVVNLRCEHPDLGELPSGLGYVAIPMSALRPTDDEVIRFLRIAADRKRAPVFVHCQAGADRTGLMVAVYRIVMQGWSKEAAIEEMTAGGYGYHRIFKGIRIFLEKLDVPRLKKESSIE